MSTCYDKFEYCSSHLSTYIAVGVLIPLGVLLLVALTYLYIRCRRRRFRRQEQQTYMSTFIPIYNNEEGHPVPYTYSYPPRYASISEEAFDKPPSYEQTVQEISETNNNNFVENSLAILPARVSSEESPR